MSWRWEARRSNTAVSKVPFLGCSSSGVRLSYCSSEVLFFMIRNTEMESKHVVYKYSLSFCVKSWCLYDEAFSDYSKWILMSGVVGCENLLNNCVCSCIISQCVVFGVWWQIDAFEWLYMLNSKLFWVFPHVFNGPIFIFLTCETGVYLQVYIHFLKAGGRLRSLKCSQVMGTHPALKWRKDGKDLERTVAVWIQLILFFQSCGVVLFRMTGLPQVKSLRRTVEGAGEQ